MISRSETDISGQYWEISDGFYRQDNNFLTEVHPFYFKRTLLASLVELIAFYSIRLLVKWRNVMKNLIKHIAQALVDKADQVSVQEISAQNALILELRVAKDDTGKVIGKKGRTAEAMRTILSCASAKENKTAILEIVE